MRPLWHQSTGFCRFPIHLIRFWLAWREAKRLLAAGPRYVNGGGPQIRTDEADPAFKSTEPGTKAAAAGSDGVAF